MAFLGIDTSNYTTSAAVYYAQTGVVAQQKKLLPVKPGEKGLRQSDTVFHHTQQLPELIEKIFADDNIDVEAIGVSSRPTTADGSYMPCFTVGMSAARILSSVNGVRLHYFSHQQGHIAAALYSAGRLELLNKRFLAFHVSGGTTEAVLVEPDRDSIFTCTKVAHSLDLKAGQAVDRVGVMLGLGFPCGAELDKLACAADKTEFNIRPSMKGVDCSLSGVENKCAAMNLSGESPENTARFCIEYIASALGKMTEELLQVYPGLPVVFSGGVMSNSIISKRFAQKYGAVFASPQFSSDNAAGVAILASIR